jgi:ribosomal protein S3
VNTKEFKLKNKVNLTSHQANFVNIFLNKKQLNFKRYLTKNFDTVKKTSESAVSLSGNNKVKANKVYINKKLHTNVKNIKKSLIFLTKTNVSLIMINALSFTKFNYYLPEKNSLLKKNPNSLITLEQQMVKFYKYSAVYISDLVNITFVSLFLKNATFLAKFIGFQLNRTPRNRKQTRLIQLINQTTKILLYQRKEIIGLRIKLKGRINGRNRGRYVYINKGVLPLQSYDSRIEYGSSKGYTRNGVIGIKIWICYDKNFNKELYNTYKQYFNYIQLTQSNKVKILDKPVKKKL